MHYTWRLWQKPFICRAGKYKLLQKKNRSILSCQSEVVLWRGTRFVILRQCFRYTSRFISHADCLLRHSDVAEFYLANKRAVGAEESSHLLPHDIIRLKWGGGGFEEHEERRNKRSLSDSDSGDVEPHGWRHTAPPFYPLNAVVRSGCFTDDTQLHLLHCNTCLWF